MIPKKVTAMDALWAAKGMLALASTSMAILFEQEILNQAITKFKHKKRKNKWVLWTRWGWDYYSSGEDPSPISRGTADHLMVLLQTCQNTHVPGKLQFLRFQEADLWLWWPCTPAGVNTCCCTTASAHWVIVWSTLWQTVQNVQPTAPLPLRTVATCKPGCQECHISWGSMATWHQNVQSYSCQSLPPCQGASRMIKWQFASMSLVLKSSMSTAIYVAKYTHKARDGTFLCLGLRFVV